MSEKLKKQLYTLIAALVVFFTLIILRSSGKADFLFEGKIRPLLLFLIPYLLCGWNVIRKAVLGVIHGQMLDECFLMTLASIGAFASGEYAEAAAVMIFYQIGEWFQSYALGCSRKSISELMEIAPEYANVEQEDGELVTTDPDEVEIGDIVVIKPGEKVPLDGEVVSGESMLNTAALTGESVPRSVSPGSPVISGCINGDGLLRVRVQKTYDDSTVSRILEMVENASEKKSHTEQFITRFARVYTPVVVVCALILAIVPSLITGEWMRWIYRACTFLVISCPCALVISVPLAFFGGIGAASRSGVLVKGSNYLEQLCRIRTLASDKTGTLTEGTFKVRQVLCAQGVSEEEVLMTAAAAEGMSTHPIAVSIREACGQRCTGKPAAVEDVENLSGLGLIARSGEDEISVGSLRLMKQRGISCDEVPDEASTIIYVAKNSRYLGAVTISDRIKPGAREALERIRQAGVRTLVLLTGDRRSVGEAVGRELGMDRVVSELLPQDKVGEVETLFSTVKEGEALAYIGDGINDAPVLMRADVGIAMGSLGSDAAIEAADVVVMDDDLNHISGTIGISRKTVRIATENIVFALGIKLLILVLGALGIANMWAAVFADVGVAVLCILNSMRLLFYGRKSRSARD